MQKEKRNEKKRKEKKRKEKKKERKEKKKKSCKILIKMGGNREIKRQKERK